MCEFGSQVSQALTPQRRFPQLGPWHHVGATMEITLDKNGSLYDPAGTESWNMQISYETYKKTWWSLPKSQTQEWLSFLFPMGQTHEWPKFILVPKSQTQEWPRVHFGSKEPDTRMALFPMGQTQEWPRFTLVPKSQTQEWLTYIYIYIYI